MTTNLGQRTALTDGIYSSRNCRVTTRVNTREVYDGGYESRKHANSHVSVAPPMLERSYWSWSRVPISTRTTSSGISRFQTSTSCFIAASAPTCRYERGRTGAACAPRSGCYFRITGATPRRFTTMRRGDTTRHRKRWLFYTDTARSRGARRAKPSLRASSRTMSICFVATHRRRRKY